MSPLPPLPMASVSAQTALLDPASAMVEAGGATVELLMPEMVARVLRLRVEVEAEVLLTASRPALVVLGATASAA